MKRRPFAELVGKGIERAIDASVVVSKGPMARVFGEAGVDRAAHNRYHTNFALEDSLDNWEVRSDSMVGGFSRARLFRSPEGYARLVGYTSTALNEDDFEGFDLPSQPPHSSSLETPIPSRAAASLRPMLKKSGFVQASTGLTNPTRKLFRQQKGGTWDVSSFVGVELKVRGTPDRVFNVSLTPQSSIPHSVYQGFVKFPDSDWCVIRMPFERLLATSRGSVFDIDRRFDFPKLTRIGFGVADAQSGEFVLDVSYLKFLVAPYEDDAPETASEEELNKPLELGNAQRWYF